MDDGFNNFWFVMRVCNIINGALLVRFVWLNKKTIYGTAVSYGMVSVDVAIRATSWFEVTYNIYVAPTVHYVRDSMRGVVDAVTGAIPWLSPDLTLKQGVKVEVIYNDGTSATLMRESMVRADEGIIDETNIAMVLVEKWSDVCGETVCAIYDDMEELGAMVNGDTVFPKRSDVVFMAVTVTTGGTTYEINLNDVVNYRMVGNKVLGERFVRYILDKQFSVELSDDQPYTVYVMDHMVDEVSLERGKHIVLEEGGYTVVG